MGTGGMSGANQLISSFDPNRQARLAERYNRFEPNALPPDMTMGGYKTAMKAFNPGDQLFNTLQPQRQDRLMDKWNARGGPSLVPGTIGPWMDAYRALPKPGHSAPMPGVMGQPRGKHPPGIM